jgi:hypothetical protein
MAKNLTVVMTDDGVRILAPASGPDHFTTRQIGKTVESVVRQRRGETATKRVAGSALTQHPNKGRK